jgi:hypothetical protein
LKALMISPSHNLLLNTFHYRVSEELSMRAFPHTYIAS